MGETIRQQVAPEMERILALLFRLAGEVEQAAHRREDLTGNRRRRRRAVEPGEQVGHGGALLHDKAELCAWQVGRICDHVEASGLHGQAMISHANCLGMIPDAALDRLGRRLADVAVPPVTRLVEMGVNVCCGSDGIRDAWSPLGNGDMLKRAFLTAFRFEWATDGQFALALACATDHAARAIGLAGHVLAPGCLADFLMIDAVNPGDALARRSHRRRVVRRGRLVADDGAPL